MAKKIPKDQFVASLMPDSDKRMGAVASASLLAALLLGFWASLYERIIDPVVFVKSEKTELTEVMTIEKKQEEKKEVKQKPRKPDLLKHGGGGGGKPKGPGNPRVPEKRGILKMLTTQTKNASADIYDLMNNQKFARDIDKVLQSANGLQTAGKVQLGERRGIANGGFNEGVAAGGSGGIANSFGELFGTGSNAIDLKGKGHYSPPKEKDIVMGSGAGYRSASDIMRVVRQRTPGLRHVYNKYLKKNSGFQGKVTLRFTISPGGEIISISMVSATTGYDAFDNEVKNTVARWTFGTVKSGNTTVTIPFTFTE